ncbi:DUF1667 domain-containing protein [Clostridium luticellarii]|uniref:DUF1667 domain-containing protein n=1 Tax=Clostridium luticellarii TaxID=1691940 RepID=A0A2T0BAN2_9CLOT|nr:DUF1667 domain-containing protein [Clostridium luticellarii]MCI1946351.1 DUF1667 domain-containing protein [Clostridium luticellarii]MCI1969582.1 DUF1667 domain-containing protein [Clostridium luticellarii]MCI1996753.1 DUF1667 domain-containing protein [Clostridium luticellarii]PRR80893.1 hypothetical protein CLLU_32780 [Clostridium luticellarii]
MIREIICNECSKKCILSMDKYENILEVKGNLCDRGIECAKLAISNKSDIFTTIVRIKGSNCNVVPVKSSKPLDKNLWIECSKVLSRIHVGAPVKMGNIICKNILNTGVDIVCTKNIDENTR